MREKAKLGIFLSALLHFSLALPFLVIALPILHFVKEVPPELAKEIPQEEESKAPPSRKNPDAMMVDIVAFSEEEPEAFAPSKFLGVEGTRQTPEFEKEAPGSVPRTQFVESLKPLKDAEKATTTEEEGAAEPTPEKAADTASKEIAASLEATPTRPSSTEATAPNPSPTSEEKVADRASKEIAASSEAAPTRPSLTEATAPNPSPTSEETTPASPPVETTPKAASSRPGKSAAAKGQLGELLQGMRELDLRLDQALEETPEAELDESQVQALIRLQDAAAQGYAHAQYRLATALIKGGSKELPEEAKKLLTRAAQSGYVEAQVLLGYLAASGERKKPDFAEALAWMNLAAEKGNKAALHGAKKLEKLMKVEEIIQAHRRTQRYRRFAASAAPAVVGIDDERPPDEILRDASATGNAELVQLMLARGADPDSVDDSGRSALINAAWRGRKKIVELLLEKGADLSVRDLEGLSAANWAAVNGHPDVIRTLGKAGANLDNRDNDNLTPLMRATWNGHFKAVTALLDEGADPNLRTPSGKTALDFAREEGYEAIQKLLQRAGNR